MGIHFNIAIMNGRELVEASVMFFVSLFAFSKEKRILAIIA